MKTIFGAQFLFFILLLWQPAVAQTSLPACTVSLPDHDDDGVAAAVDIDKDNDGLIEICDIEGINELRYQLDGSGYTTSTDAVKNIQGCPTTGCNGYELMRSLDFNADASYRTTSNKVIWTTEQGWQPIGSNANRFSGIFDGNGFTIANLYINRANNDLGLFSVLGTAGEINNVGLLNVSVKGHSKIGGLVGVSHASIINSYATGNVTATGNNATDIGGLVGVSHASIINSYAAANVTAAGNAENIGGLVGANNRGTIINSYAIGAVAGNSNMGGLVGVNAHAASSITNSYAAVTVSGTGSNIGGLVGNNRGRVTASYWDTSTIMEGDAGIAKTTAELQSPTEATGIYSDWSSNDWDFGDSADYPILRYAKGGDLNACAAEITTSSAVLPCTIVLPDQNERTQGLAGIFFFADGELAEVVSDPPLFSQGIYHYDMTIVAANLNIHIRPYALSDRAKITISDRDNPNGALSDAIGLEDNETTLTIVITDTVDETTVTTTYTYTIVRLLPLQVDVSRSRISVIFEPSDPYPDGGIFSYQWQQRLPGLGWANIPGATTATYSLPAAANSGILYRVVNITHTDPGGYIINYPDQGPFRATVDNDGDGLIDIYYLEDIDAMRYQLNGRAYQPNEDAEPIMRGCPLAVCRGYELMRSLDFNVADSYIDSTIDTASTTSTGWQPIGSNANRFSGIFDGNSFTIANLYINRANNDLGLFSVLGTAGEINNVGLLNVSVEGSGSNIGGLVGRSFGRIINSYVTGDISVTGSASQHAGGLVGWNNGRITNSYVAGNVSGTNEVGGLVGRNFGRNSGRISNSYVVGNVSGTGSYIGGLVARSDGLITNSYVTAAVAGRSIVGGLISLDTGSVIASYWDTGESRQTISGGKTSAELQSPTAPTGIYSNWSSDDWDFGDSHHYPALRYAKGDNLNACATDITTSSAVLPCAILLPNQKDRTQGLAGIFFFADGEPAEVVLDPLWSNLTDHYVMTIVAADLNIQLRPYALNDRAKITITDQSNRNYFADKPNGVLSDAIRLEDNETTLTVVIAETVGETTVTTTYTYVIVRWLPLQVAVSQSRFSVILEPEILDVDDADIFSYQWQQQKPGEQWTNIAAATTATYWLPAAVDSSIRYRVTIRHTDGGGYITNYPALGPFKASVDGDGDGLIDIYTLEDLDAIRYQLNGRAYKSDEHAEPLMLGCPVTGCNGYELMSSLDFNAAASYYTTSNKAIWTTASGWQPIGSDDNHFRSIFDGNDFTIANLFMNRAESQLGLFSMLHANGEIKNVGLLDVNIEEGRDDIGGLVGLSLGRISNSYATGAVAGDSFTGGLVGFSQVNSSIINSYATATVTGRRRIGGLVGENGGSIINSYATGNVTGRESQVGGLVSYNYGSINNSYATGAVVGNNSVGGLVGVSEINSIISNSYATGAVVGNNSVGGLVGVSEINSIISNSYATGAAAGDGSIGGLVGREDGRTIASYWNTQTSGIMASGGGVAKTTAELQSPTAATGIYSNWSSKNWDFGNSDHYPILRYASKANLNACTNNITTSSVVLPCAIALPNQQDRTQGLAGIFFFADGERAPVVLEPLFSQGIYNYAMTVVAADPNIQLRPYALNDSAKITITDQDNQNYFADKPNRALSEAIGLEDNETTLTIVITDTAGETTVTTTYTYTIERLLPLQVIVSLSQLRFTLGSAISPDDAGFSYQWQQQKPGEQWTNIAGATTATYWLPADANGSIRYRAVNIKHTGRDRYMINYPNQGPFRTNVDDDGDGLIDIYTVEDLNAIRYQLDGRAYQSNANAKPLMLGCPVAGCRGYELMSSLDFNAAASYYTTSNEAIWTTAPGWQPIGSDANRFRSLFDGNDFTIANLFMNRAESQLGLFSMLHANGEIKNVGLLDVNIEEGGDDIGGLVGQNFGRIINSYATGAVAGDVFIGGLVGYSHINSSIINSYAAGTVTGRWRIGGLVGDNFGLIANSYATGNVTGRESQIGGLVSYNYGSIINSYATGAVAGSSSIGGLVGMNEISSIIVNSYATGMITGNSNIGGLVGSDSGSIIASYWDAETSGQMTSAGGNGVTPATTAQLQSPTTPGTETTEFYYGWSSNDWDFGDSSHYPALRYANRGDLNACVTDLMPSSTALPCGILLPDQSSRDRGLAGVFFFTKEKIKSTILSPLFSQRIYSYNKVIVTTGTAVQLTLRPYALNDNATITITDQDHEDYFADKLTTALSEPIMLSEPTTLTVVVTDTINEVPVNTTYTFAIKQAPPLEVSAITLSPTAAAAIDEGDTITLTFDVGGGSDTYEYAYLLDDQLLPSPLPSPFEFTLATDIVAAAATTQTIELTIRISGGDGQSFEHNEDLTIQKVNNGDLVITSDISAKYLRVILEQPDPDGDGEFNIQWQSQERSGKWMNIANATTATYWLPVTDDSIRRYRAINISYTDGQGFVKDYADQGPFPDEAMVMGDITGARQADEGGTLTLTAPTVIGGSGEYNYTWTHTVEDDTQLSSHSALTLTSTNTATVNAQIPADFIASAATSANIIFKVVVDDGFTMTSQSTVATIHKIDNGLADIATTEVNAILSVTVTSDPDGDATTPNYAYQWQQRAPVADSLWLDIDAATATYSVLSNTPADTRFRVLVTYTDGQGYRKTKTSNEIRYVPQFSGLRIRTKVFLEGPLR